MAEFTPDQLDILEDALAGISGPEPALVPGLEDDALATRLGQYGEILGAAREAYVDEDVPVGLLDDVLAEAQAAVADTSAAAAASVGAGWWARWRAVLVPAAVLAGSAAAVLLFLKPPGEAPGGDGPIARADTPTTEAVKDTTSRTLPPAPALPDDAPEPEPLDVPPAAEDGDESASGAAAGAATIPASKRAPKSKKGAAVDPAPAPVHVSKDDGWDELQRAHTLRRKGECDRATTIYKRLADSSLGEAGRGQALAGLGLCRERGGDQVGAQRAFSEARGVTPEIDGWIASQSGSSSSGDKSSGGQSTSKKSKKSKKARAAKKQMAAEAMADDPFRK